MSMLLRYDGTLTVQEKETDKSHVIPVKIYEENNRFTVIIFNFVKHDLELFEPAISILITNFALDPFSIDLIAHQGPPDKSDDQKKYKSWLLRFDWIDKEAKITALEEIKKNDSSSAT